MLSLITTSIFLIASPLVVVCHSSTRDQCSYPYKLCKQDGECQKTLGSDFICNKVSKCIPSSAEMDGSCKPVPSKDSLCMGTVYGYCILSDIDVCSLPILPGSCTRYTTRYGFNDVTEQCEEFTYGGCKGNDNRFITLEDCQQSCEPCNGVVCEPESDKCEGEGIDSECCPFRICDCSNVSCQPRNCDETYIREGSCCPVCDCDAVSCPDVSCDEAYLPNGECCPICVELDCNGVICEPESDKCEVEGIDSECCPFRICDCSNVSCQPLNCDESYIRERREGSCCPVCDCNGVSCPDVFCDGAYFPHGECCPICAEVAESGSHGYIEVDMLGNFDNTDYLTFILKNSDATPCGDSIIDVQIRGRLGIWQSYDDFYGDRYGYVLHEYYEPLTDFRYMLPFDVRISMDSGRIITFNHFIQDLEPSSVFTSTQLICRSNAINDLLNIESNPQNNNKFINNWNINDGLMIGIVLITLIMIIANIVYCMDKCYKRNKNEYSKVAIIDSSDTDMEISENVPLN